MNHKKLNKDKFTSPFSTTREIIDWAASNQDHLSSLQDICLDHYDTEKKERAIKLLKEISELKKDIAIFQEECDNIFQELI